MRRKLNAMPAVFAGKRVLLVDDSIVRGTTMSQIVDMVRRAGASKVRAPVLWRRHLCTLAMCACNCQLGSFQLCLQKPDMIVLACIWLCTPFQRQLMRLWGCLSLWRWLSLTLSPVAVECPKQDKCCVVAQSAVRLRQVYLASASPPVRHANVYGVDMPTRREFVAFNLSEEEICTVRELQPHADLLHLAPLGSGF